LDTENQQKLDNSICRHDLYRLGYFSSEVCVKLAEWNHLSYYEKAAYIEMRRALQDLDEIIDGLQQRIEYTIKEIDGAFLKSNQSKVQSSLKRLFSAKKAKYTISFAA
jgi:hypothetical protein